MSLSAIKPSELGSSDSSLVTMHPVASGDNVSTGFKSAHRLKEAPTLVPCCEGKELAINEDLIQSGLSAISVKHQTVLDCISLTKVCVRNDSSESIPPTLGVVNHRNSFRSLHRPDLRRVPCLRKMAPQELESLFRGYTDPASGSKRTGAGAAPVSAAPTPDGLTEPQGEECVRVMLPTPEDPSPAHTKSRDESTVGPINGGSAECTTNLRPIPESGASLAEASTSVLSAALPSGMRLHGARGRIYTSVQAAAARAPPGDRKNGTSPVECEMRQSEEDNEDQATSEEVHIILSPRSEEQMPSEPSTTTATFSIGP